jgi:hypothetical protein
MLYRLSAFAAVAMLALALGQAPAADEADPLASLKEGGATLKSAGPLAFGPKGILFVGDTAAAAIAAIDTGDRDPSAGKEQPKVEDLAGKIAAALGTEEADILIKDMAVNSISGNTYLSVARGKGPTAPAVLLKVTPSGKITELDIKKARGAVASLPEAGKGGKADSITHIAFVKGRVLVAGLSNEDFASKLRSIPFPFARAEKGTSLEIYHGAHGKWETKSPVRVFAPYKIGDEDHILAAYTCTPLVKMPLNSLKPGEKIKAVTVAELGNRNRPLSMIVYKKDGKDFVLMANSARGLMKISLEGIDKAEGITSRIPGTAGLKYDTIKEAEGVQKLDAFGPGHAVLLTSLKGKWALTTIALP